MLFVLACVEPQTSETSLTGWTDRDGRSVFHRGMNIGEEAKWTDDNLPHFDDAALDLLPEYGITLARYLVFWQAIEPERGNYDDAYVDAVAADLMRLNDRGIDVVIDFHQDVWGEGFGYTGFPRWTCDESVYATFTPSEIAWGLDYLSDEVMYCFDSFWASEALQSEYASMLVYTADRLDPYVIGYDTMNEPHWGSANPLDLEAGAFGTFQANNVAALRTVSDGWIALEPMVSANLTGESALPFPDDPRIIYAPHFYPGASESGYDGDFADEAQFLGGFHAYAQPRPLWIGEFGIFTNTGTEADFVHATLDTLSSIGASSTYWAFNPRTLFDAETNTPLPLLEAWKRPYIHRVPGAIQSISATSVTYAPTAPGLPLEVIMPVGACSEWTLTATPAMSGMGTGSATGRLTFTGEQTSLQSVEIVCSP